jgi:nucleoside-diphosphate-sugar epimerase
MKVLVVGASGFLGRNILLEAPRDWQIVGVYRDSSTFLDFVRERGLQNVVPLRSSLQDKQEAESLRTATGGTVDVCVMVWGNSDIGLSVREPLLDLSANLVPLLNLLKAVEIRRFIFVSSGTVYLGQRGIVSETAVAQPLVPYGITKLASELYIRAFVEERRTEMEYVVARFFGAFGPYEPPRKIYTKLVQAFALNGERSFSMRGNGENLIDAMYVSDAVAGLLRMATADAANVTVNFAMGQPTTINELVRRAARLFGVSEPELVHEGATAEPIGFLADTSLMRNLYGLAPQVTLEDGLLLLERHLREEMAQ